MVQESIHKPAIEKWEMCSLQIFMFVNDIRMIFNYYRGIEMLMYFTKQTGAI